MLSAHAADWAIRDTLTGQRDRALLLLGFAGALRRSERAAVRREHLTFTAEGMKLPIPRTKTDQEGRGAEIGIPRGMKPETCPVRAREVWLRAGPSLARCRGPLARYARRCRGAELAVASAGPGALLNAGSAQDHLGAAVAATAPPTVSSWVWASGGRLLRWLDYQQAAEPHAREVGQRPPRAVIIHDQPSWSMAPRLSRSVLAGRIRNGES